VPEEMLEGETKGGGNSALRNTQRASPPPKEYTPNSPTSIALNYINIGSFYSSTLKL
jgi:hypothetical protein